VGAVLLPFGSLDGEELVVDVVAEGFLDDQVLGKGVEGLAEGAGEAGNSDPLEPGVVVGTEALVERLGRVVAVADAVEGGCEGDGEGEVRFAIESGQRSSIAASSPSAQEGTRIREASLR
jgi:hypothetical protein